MTSLADPARPPRPAPHPVDAARPREASSPDWLVLHDIPNGTASPLVLDLLHHEISGRVQAFLGALGQPDPDGLGRRLLAAREGRPALHAPNLRALIGDLDPPLRTAFCTALGVQPPFPDRALPDRAPRLDLLRLPLLRGGPALAPTISASTQLDPVRRLRIATDTLGRHPATLVPFTAALTADLLGTALRHWLETSEALPLDWLCGLDGPDSPGHATFARADQQARTTLTGGRRNQYRSLLIETRRHHVALHHWENARARTYRSALRAAAELGRDLARRGLLVRPADARLLRTEELIAAHDDRLTATELRTLARLRREPDLPVPPAPPRSAQVGRWHGTPLAPGVRDGVVHHWPAQMPAPAGEALVLVGPAPRHWPLPEGVVGAVLTDCLPLGQAAREARERGLVALALPRELTAGLKDGDRVRLDAYRGTVTLLQAAPAHATPQPGENREERRPPPAPAPLLLDLKF